MILRAHAAGMPIVQLPVEVYYPPEEERITHFHKVRDPARIVGMNGRRRDGRCPLIHSVSLPRM